VQFRERKNTVYYSLWEEYKYDESFTSNYSLQLTMRGSQLSQVGKGVTERGERKEEREEGK